MITRFQLLRNIGKFDSVNEGSILELKKLALIYGENGRGKTTIAAILRSLSQGDPLPIEERHRLSADNPPHIVVGCDDGQADLMFKHGVWNRILPNIVVFDDEFVNRNVYSGLTVELDQRQNLHELILGGEGVKHNQDLQGLVTKIEEHNGALRLKGASIPESERHGFPPRVIL